MKCEVRFIFFLLRRSLITLLKAGLGVTKKQDFFTGEVTARVENENDQQELQNCMNEAAFSNCNAEEYINTDKDVQTEPDTMDINELVQKFRESQKKERGGGRRGKCHCVRRRKVQSEDLSGCCQKFKGTAEICRTTG